MTYYFKSGNIVKVEPSDALEVLDSLPPSTYVVKKNEQTNRLYLQTTNDLELPPKLYGVDPTARANRVITTFMERTKSTGVLLSGDKGSGKTMLAKLIGNKLINEYQLPVIVVNEPWCGPIFNELISNITQPAMVIFDEFDKVYDEEDQQLMLTLLDGTVDTKKLFVLTTNAGHVDENLINRPGRVYYHYHYDGLGEDFVREFATDTLNNKCMVESVVSVANAFSTMTFDMLQALIEECNRFNENPFDAMHHINVNIANDSATYKVHIMYDGSPITNTYYPYTIGTNPMFMPEVRDIDIYVGDGKTFGEEDRKVLGKANLEIGGDRKYTLSKGGIITYTFEIKGKELLVILEKEKRMNFNWDAF